MEDFGKRDDTGKDPLKFPEEIKDTIKHTDVCIYAAGSRPGELDSFRRPMHEIIDTPTIRHAHMIGITEDMMRTGMCADYSQIQKLSKKIHDLLIETKTIQVTTKNGTDLKAHFNKKIRWLVCDGNIPKGRWKNLPGGEVYTCPENINGTAIIDGVLGDYFDKKYGKLNNTPLTIKIENSRVKHISCKNKQLEDELKAYIKTDKNSNRIGEFAIGTNIGIKEIIGQMLQDEKHPGVHIAMGDSFSRETGSGWSSTTHIDGVMLNCTIILDNRKTIMKDGKFTFL